MLDIDVDSLVSQLKNKVSYRLEQTLKGAVNDPEANQHAKEKEELKASVGTGDVPEEIPANLSAVEKMLRKMKRIIIRIKDRMISLFITFIIPLILAMFVANESVMYPAPVRIIYFVFTFILCYVNQAAVVLLGTIYLGRFAYDYYVNKMEKRGVPLIVPPILAVLPVKIFDPSSTPSFFKDLIQYPMIYPRNERGENNLLVIMNDYLESLKKSFTYLDNVKSMPMFVEKLKKIDENMEQLHKPIPEPVEKEENKEINVKLPPTIAEHRAEKGLPPLNTSVQENKNRPLPLTIREQREKNGLPPITSVEKSDEKVNTQNEVEAPLPAIIAEKITSNESLPAPPNYNGKEANTSAPLPPVIKQQEANTSAPPNYNGKEATTSAPPNYNGKEANTSAPLPPVIKQQEANTSAPPNYNGKEANTSAPPNYNGKEANTSAPLPPVIKQQEANTSAPPNYNGKEATTSAPPNYNSVPNKGNQSQVKTPKK
jgi:hypothetical protein